MDIKQGQLVKEIPLSQGKVALVDAADYDELMQWKWYAVTNHRNWYAERNIYGVNGKHTKTRMHNVLMGIKGVDHINGNGLDNRRSNLRLATNQQNAFNKRHYGRGSSVYKGVYRRKDTNKWAARIMFNAKNINLGCFCDEVEAAMAYDAKARELFGEFALVNFPSARELVAQAAQMPLDDAQREAAITDLLRLAGCHQ